MSLRKISEYFKSGSFCFYCNVDSEELKLFLIIVIGGLVFASIFVAAGAWFGGHFKNVENSKIKEKVLTLEGEQDG